MAQPGAARAGRWRRVVVDDVLLWSVSNSIVGSCLAGGGSFQDASWVFFAQASALVPALLAIVLTRRWSAPLRESLGLRLRRVAGASSP